MDNRIAVSVPGSIGNLGSGFDCAGMSIALRNRFVFEPAGRSGLEGFAGGAHEGGRNVCLRAFRAACAAAGMRPPAVLVRTAARIPAGRGLGSSATAVLSGTIAGFLAAGLTPDAAAVVAAGRRFEGCMDNLAASLLGGFVIAAEGPEGPVLRRIAVPRSLRAVFFVSGEPFATRAARRILPARVPLRDAAANAAMAGFLVLAFARANWYDLRIGMDDRLHQPRRSGLYPHFVPLRDAALAAGAAGCCISGAGPSVVALAQRGAAADVAAAWRDLCAARGFHGDVREIAPGGRTVWRSGSGPCTSLS